MSEKKPEITDHTRDVLVQVAVERAKQALRWGEQNHDAGKWLAILMEEIGEFSRDKLDRDMVGCEKYDVEKKMREELVQVAAVAVAMIEAFDRGYCR